MSNDPTPTSSDGDGGSRSPLQAVADAVARHYKEQFGRGPQRCRAHSAGPHGIVVVVEGTLSPAERRLIGIGEGSRVRAARSALHAAVRIDLIALVTEASGRSVVHAVDGIDVDGDVSSELFLFAD